MSLRNNIWIHLALWSIVCAPCPHADQATLEVVIEAKILETSSKAGNYRELLCMWRDAFCSHSMYLTTNPYYHRFTLHLGGCQVEPQTAGLFEKKGHCHGKGFNRPLMASIFWENC